MEGLTIKAISEVQPEEVAELVRDLTPVKDMALLLAVDECELRDALDDPRNALHWAYATTLAKVKREIRHRNIELAESLSPTATEAVAEYLNQIEMDR